MFRRFLFLVTAYTLFAVSCFADCSNLPNFSQLKTALVQATNDETSGLNMNMWATIVDRDGIVCAVAFTVLSHYHASRSRHKKQTPLILLVWIHLRSAVATVCRWPCPRQISTPRFNPEEAYSDCRRAIRSIPAPPIKGRQQVSARPAIRWSVRRSAASTCLAVVSRFTMAVTTWLAPSA